MRNYRITRIDENTWRVVDSQSGRDGADLLTQIEKLNFADLSAVDLTLDNPLPADDVITLDNRSGTQLIKVSDLLKNDRDWQGDALHITTLSDLKDGTVVGSYNSTSKEWTPTTATRMRDSRRHMGKQCDPESYLFYAENENLWMEVA